MNTRRWELEITEPDGNIIWVSVYDCISVHYCHREYCLEWDDNMHIKIDAETVEFIADFNLDIIDYSIMESIRWNKLTNEQRTEVIVSILAPMFGDAE